MKLEKIFYALFVMFSIMGLFCHRVIAAFEGQDNFE